VPHPKSFKLRLTSRKGRAPFPTGILRSSERDGLVGLAKSVIAKVPRGMECSSGGKMEEEQNGKIEG
jgi:hypothetical protein